MHRLRAPPPLELYDLLADPNEYMNLARASEHNELVHALRAQLRAFRLRTAEPLMDGRRTAEFSSTVDNHVRCGRTIINKRQ